MVNSQPFFLELKHVDQCYSCPRVRGISTEQDKVSRAGGLVVVAAFAVQKKKSYIQATYRPIRIYSLDVEPQGDQYDEHNV